MRQSTALSLAGVAIAFLAACGGGSGVNEPGTTATVTTGATAVTPSTGPGPTATSSPTPPTPSATKPGAATSEPTPTEVSVQATNVPTGTTPSPVQTQQTTPTQKPSGGGPSTATVGVTGTTRFFWTPANVQIGAGGTVTWTWSEPVQPHNVVGTDFSFGPTGILKQDTMSYTFATPGVFHFTCEVHPDTMRGTVTVQ